MPNLYDPDQIALLNSYITQNTGNIAVNLSHISDNNTMITTLTAQNTALGLANADLLNNNITLAAIIAEIPDDPSGIALLGSYVTENLSTITDNDTTITNNSALISSLNDQNTMYTSTNTTLAANTTELNAIIAEIS